MTGEDARRGPVAENRRARRRDDGYEAVRCLSDARFGGISGVAAWIFDAKRSGSRLGALRGRGGCGWRVRGVTLRCDGGLKAHPTSGFILRRKQRRQSAGAEIREQIDQRVEDAEQHQADACPEKARDQSLVTPRRDRLAHVVQDDSQVGIGVKRDGVGQGGSIKINDESRYRLFAHGSENQISHWCLFHGGRGDFSHPPCGPHPS
jgi:hypothetical protein